MSTAELPKELVVEILSRLPSKPLLRFRCVSKPWRSLIDSSSFVRLHLSKNRNSKIYIFRGVRTVSIRNSEAILSFTEVDLLNCSNRLHFQSLTLPMFSPYEVEVVGSCDGLICLTNLFFRKIVLVNPSTREYKMLPPLSEELTLGALGLGYDGSADENKVVLIPQKQSEVYIYGSKSNTWRQVAVSGKRNGGKFEGYGQYMHGALHWLVDRRDQFIHIVAFDLVNEKFTEADYDKEMFGNPDYVSLVARGRFCLYCTHNVEEEEGYLDIWVMEEYGVRESWSKLVSFDAGPIAFSNCGRRFLFRVFPRLPCSCSLHWYDLDKKSVEHVDTWMASDYHVCLQSLIRLEGKLP